MSRVRMPGRLHGVTKSPPFAWSGWRLRIPGGPEGGQYHGYIAPDSTQSWEGGQGGWPGGRSEIAEGPQKRPSGHSLLPGQGTSAGPWAREWGGTSFGEGETHSDYVYRSPSEMRPRPNASGGQNVIVGNQDERTAGYAEAPGNYRGLGMIMAPVTRAPIGVTPTYPVNVKVGPDMWPIPRGGPVYYNPLPPTTIPTPGSGATNVVAQPPASQGPRNIYIVPWTPTPISPAPAPVVAATPADYLPSQGQVIDGLTPGTPAAPTSSTSFTDWLSQSTIIPNVQNQWILFAVAGAFLMMNSGKGKR
jgi:hypothetical protein